MKAAKATVFIDSLFFIQLLLNFTETPCHVPTCTGAVSDNPSSGGPGCLEETFPEDSLQLGLKVKVEDSSMDGDEQFGEVQTPVLRITNTSIIMKCEKKKK